MIKELFEVQMLVNMGLLCEEEQAILIEYYRKEYNL